MSRIPLLSLVLPFLALPLHSSRVPMPWISLDDTLVARVSEPG